MACPFLAPSFPGACLGGAIGRGDPEDQTAAQAQL
jgi:hypothetical protein